MKLVEARVKLPKELVYDTYIRIVYDYRDYDEISRKEMLKEIIDIYHEENFMYHICTKRELEFISKFYKQKPNLNDLKKYSWEITELDKKYIFNAETFSFYEEYDDIIPSIIDYYKKNNKENFPLSMFIVSLVRIYGEIIVKVVKSLSNQIYNIDVNKFDNYLGNPLIHFYCNFDNNELSFGKEETIFYRDYEDDIYDLREQRKILGVAGTIQIDRQLFEDFYYYGVNYSNPIVKKMYDKVMINELYHHNLFMVERCRILGIPYLLKNIDPNSDLIEEALQEMPCAAMNGVTPKEREKILLEEETLKQKFTCIPQNNAHVHRDIAKKFYYYFFALLEYTNNKYKINDKVKKIYKQENLDPYKLSSIQDYLWKHKEIIDDFIKINPYKFDENDFYYINQFKTTLSDNNYVFIGTEREYAKFLSKDNKIYMVKGLNSDIDEVLDLSKVPYMVNTYLLEFENYIIYTGMISNYEISFGNEFKVDILKNINNSIKYYHF